MIILAFENWGWGGPPGGRSKIWKKKNWPVSGAARPSALRDYIIQVEKIHRGRNRPPVGTAQVRSLGHVSPTYTHQ